MLGILYVPGARTNAVLPYAQIYPYTGLVGSEADRYEGNFVKANSIYEGYIGRFTWCD